MIASKHITAVVAVLMALCVLLCLLAVVFSGALTTGVDAGVTMEYESKLFDTETPISINILMAEADWTAMLENAIEETYYSCDVEIGGRTFYNVGIRPKGNTSLTSIASDPDTDRYSLKLEFDHYVEGQTCYGLDKLILNNNYADATCMKEALVYDMYQYLGADASLYNYAKLSVNGSYWGAYLALEAVEQSFLLRNYGTQRGALYKPDSMNMGGGPGGQGGGPGGERPEGFGAPGDGERPAQPPEGMEFAAMEPGQAPGGGFGGMGGGSDLNYTDDDLDSYTTIWEGEVTDTGKADHRRVVKALKNIAEGAELESSMDIDNLLKYMAVHVFSVNEDSLSGNMTHNYYLYEHNGKLNLIPWDYNLSLGGMGGSDASSVVNSPIDEAFAGTKFFDTLMQNETYQARYHAYLAQLVEQYIDGGGFDAFYTRTRAQLDALAATDPTAFYSCDAYVAAADTLYDVVKLRGASIQAQLAGAIPSTQSGRSAADALIDASDIDLAAMGSMHRGDGLEDMRGARGEQGPQGGQDRQGEQSAFVSSDGALRPGAWQPPEGFGGMPGESVETTTQGYTPYIIALALFLPALALVALYRRRRR